ncbi:Hypothetical protein D9617_3g021780 [Elsinoe fawcettii]|nr:Hypothetical protein D9617_3g021780 [Elsinoe fawcettii]
MPLRQVAHAAPFKIPSITAYYTGLPAPDFVISPGRRACQRVLLLQPRRHFSVASGVRFTTYFDAYRPARPRVSISTDASFYTPSYVRRVASTTRQSASVDSALPATSPIPFPIQTHGIPAANEPIHSALQELNILAPEFVNQSRLQLALRSLESTAPTIRIAIVGVGATGFSKARRLARLLVADPLDIESTVEQRLTQERDADGRAILLRHSDIEEENGFGGVQGGQENPLLKTLNIKSPALHREGVEILVAQVQGNLVSTERQSEGSVLETALLPVLNSPLAGSGRAGFVRFPVHKAIVLAEGFDGALALSDYAGHIGKHESGLIRTALDLPVSDKSLSHDAINIEAAERALRDFRRDVGTGPRFSETWQSSGVGDISSILKIERKGILPAPLRDHVESMLHSSEQTITATRNDAQRETASLTIPETTRNELQQAIGSWSEYAHTDLQDTMAAAFASSTWRRTSFPRVLWRIDDVSYSGSGLLHSNFLVESETYLAFLTGRIGEAGFFSGNSRPSISIPGINKQEDGVDSSIDPLRGLSSSQLTRIAETRDSVKAVTGVDPFMTKPWPVGLTACRHSLLTTLVPSLHARAQALVLQCLGLVGSTSALGAWYVVATAGSGIYEAGAIVGLGTVWALRRLQKLWGAERIKFEGEVKEQGRLVLGDVESRLRTVVREGRRPQINPEDQQRWSQARQLVQKCQELLSKL